MYLWVWSRNTACKYLCIDKAKNYYMIKAGRILIVEQWSVPTGWGDTLAHWDNNTSVSDPVALWIRHGSSNSLGAVFVIGKLGHILWMRPLIPTSSSQTVESTICHQWITQLTAKIYKEHSLSKSSFVENKCWFIIDACFHYKETHMLPSATSHSIIKPTSSPGEVKQ